MSRGGLRGGTSRELGGSTWNTGASELGDAGGQADAHALTWPDGGNGFAEGVRSDVGDDVERTGGRDRRTDGMFGVRGGRGEVAGRGSADDGDVSGATGGAGDGTGLDGDGLGTDGVSGDAGTSDLGTGGEVTPAANEGTGLISSDADEGVLPVASVQPGEGIAPNTEFTEVENEITAYENLIGGINAATFDPHDLNNGFATNCGSCALAVELKLAGIDPEAVAEAKQIGTVSEMEALTGKTQVSMDPAQIEAFAHAAGPGYHGVVGFDWKGTSTGHWVNVVTSASGHVYVLDGQCGRAILMSEYLQIYARPEETEHWDLSC